MKVNYLHKLKYHESLNSNLQIQIQPNLSHFLRQKKNQDFSDKKEERTIKKLSKSQNLEKT